MTGLIGWWPLHRTFGDAVDLSGEGNDGTVNNTIRGAYGPGGLQSHYWDGGNSTYVEIPSGTFPNDSDISIFFWWNQHVQERSRPVAPRADLDATIFMWNDLTMDAMDIRWDATNYTIISNPGLNVWNHIGITFDTDSGTLKGYYNGSEQFSTSETIPGSGSQRNILGSDSSVTNNYPMTGQISGLRVYNRPISSNEVQRLYEWGSGDYASPPGELDGGVAYYKLDEDPSSTSTAADSFRGNDGTINGATQADPAIRGTGMDFDSSNTASVTFPNLGMSTVSAQSVSLWARIEDNFTDSFHPVVLKRKTADFAVRTDDGFRRSDGNQGFGVHFLDSGNNWSWDNSVPVSELNTQQWYHFAGTWDGSTGDTVFYINGEQRGSDSIGTTVQNANEENAIMADAFEDRRYGDGQVDELRIYNRVLTQEEVQELYRHGTFGIDMREKTVNAR